MKTHSTASYVSRDVPRGLTLVYRSGRAHPLPVVEVDVQDFTPGPAPTSIELHLLDEHNVVVPLTNGGASCPSPTSPCQVVRRYQPGVPNRLAAQFDASGLATGAYAYTAVVMTFNASNTPINSVNVPVRVLVDGFHNAQSPYGAGWGLAGLQRFTWVTGGLVIVDGDGTIGFWATGSTSGSVTSYTAPPGDATQVTWDASVGILTRRAPDGTVARFDGTGAQLASADRFGNTTAYTYQDGAKTRLETVTDPAGQTTILQYFGLTFPSYGYRTGALGHIIDPPQQRDLALWGVDSASNEVRSIRDAALQWEGLVYDGAHRLTRVHDVRGGYWDYGYDAFGMLDSAAAPPIAVSGGMARVTTTQTSWAAAVLPAPGTGSWYNAGPGPSLVSAVPRATVTGPDGLVTRLQLDGWGAPTRVEAPGGVVTTATRDGNGRVTQTVDARGDVTTYRWNPTTPFLLDSVDDAAAHVGTAYTYDAANAYGVQQTRVNGREVEFRTYSNGRLASVRGGGSGQGSTTYDYAGRPAGDARPSKVTDPGGHYTSFTYESSGLQNASGSTSPAGTTTVAHDLFGRDSVTTDPLGHRTVAVYDVLNRPTAVTDANGHTTTTAYDALYARTVTDAVGQVYQDSVNAAGLPFFSYDPGGRATQTTYDAAGRVASVTNRRGQAVSFGYDATLGYLSLRVSADPGQAPSVNATYGADALGSVRWGRNAESVDSVFTDALGRDSVAVHVIAPGAAGSATYVLTYTYDALGRRASVALAQRGGAAAGTARYHYNAADQLDSLWDASGAVTTFSYDPDGALTGTALPGAGSLSTPPTNLHRANGVRFPNNVTLDDAFGHELQFDRRGRVRERLSAASGLTSGTGYGYDAAGQLDSVYTVQYDSAPDAACTPLYGPGGAGLAPTSPGEQPTGYSCPPGIVTRSVSDLTTSAWDAVGNPVRNDVNVASNTGNQLEWANGYHHDFDADGQVARRFKPYYGAVQYLSWNALGQLTGVNNAPIAGSGWALTDSVTFGYDAWGRRVRKTDVTTGATTYFVWDGDALAATLQGGALARYTDYPGAVDRPHSVTVGPAGQAGATYYYVQDDAPGNVLGLIAADGSVAATYAYDVWGRPTAAGEAGLGGWSNPRRFAGREYDAETGLYSNRARYYDPSLGRFLSPDPTGLSGGINEYAYAANDPVNHADPSGTECVTWVIFMRVPRGDGTEDIINLGERVHCTDGPPSAGGGSGSGQPAQPPPQPPKTKPVASNKPSYPQCVSNGLGTDIKLGIIIYGNTGAVWGAWVGAEIGSGLDEAGAVVKSSLLNNAAGKAIGWVIGVEGPRSAVSTVLRWHPVRPGIAGTAAGAIIGGHVGSAVGAVQGALSPIAGKLIGCMNQQSPNPIQ